MVGWLIQNQEVKGLKKHHGHGQTGTFAPRQYLHFLLHIISAEYKGTQDIPDATANITHCYTVDCLQYRKISIQDLILVLCKIAQLHIVAQFQAS